MVPRILNLMLAVTLLLVETAVRAVAQAPTATLSNGTYQLCSQPPPQNWQQGAGVCLVARKQNDRIDGYYGYPHSDAFVCLRGILQGTEVTGTGYFISWQGNHRDTVPSQPFFWDEEERLQLDQAQVIQSDAQPPIAWVMFQKATLDLTSFQLYREAQMTPPQQLCDWNFH